MEEGARGQEVIEDIRSRAMIKNQFTIELNIVKIIEFICLNRI